MLLTLASSSNVYLDLCSHHPSKSPQSQLVRSMPPWTVFQFISQEARGRTAIATKQMMSSRSQDDLQFSHRPLAPKPSSWSWKVYPSSSGACGAGSPPSASTSALSALPRGSACPSRSSPPASRHQPFAVAPVIVVALDSLRYLPL